MMVKDGGARPFPSSLLINRVSSTTFGGNERGLLLTSRVRAKRSTWNKLVGLWFKDAEESPKIKIHSAISLNSSESEKDQNSREIIEFISREIVWRNNLAHRLAFINIENQIDCRCSQFCIVDIHLDMEKKMSAVSRRRARPIAINRLETKTIDKKIG